MSENQKSRRGTSAEITLDLVVRTVCELNRLSPNPDAIYGDVLAKQGQQAIEVLSIWARLLEIEKKTGAAAKNAEEVLTRWEAERQEYNRTREKSEREARQRVDWATIPRTQPIPFADAARMILPKHRHRIMWLERILTIMEEESPPQQIRKRICRMALETQSVPEGLIPELKASRDTILKRYKSRIAKQSGRKGGIKRAQKYSKNKKAAENDSNKAAS
jgi:hypothetical protein